ncbi:MAG: hypothetical protein IMF11_22695 [Proteobacteria bacterium]|nr:hypothetical protein [Pseudomonadota bacterium]
MMKKKVKIFQTRFDLALLALAAAGGLFFGASSYAQITSPTSAVPVFVESVEDTDVMIVYQIESTVVDALSLEYGMYVGLDLFHESNLSDPVYSFLDPNVLTTGAGESRIFHWNGYTNTSTRVPPGRYTVRITLYNHNFEPVGWSEQEDNSIIIAVSNINIAAGSDAYLARHGVMAGEDGLNINYGLSPVVSYDEVVMRVYDAGETEIARPSNTTDLDGTITWNSWTLDRTIVAAGSYTVEVELKRRGVSLGSSERHPFTVYEVDLQATDTLEGDEESPGVFLPAGQETNITLLFHPAGAGLGGSVHLADTSASDSVEFTSASGPVDLTAGIDIPLTDLETGFVLTARSTSLNPMPVELVANYLPSAAPAHKREADKVVLVLSGIDMDVDADRDGIVEDSFEDDIDEDKWAIGSGNKGAIVLVNSDDDDNDNLPDNWAVHSNISHAVWDSEPNDNVINADPDTEDIAPLIVRKIDLEAFPAGASITLSVEIPADDPAYFSGFAANERLRIFHPNQVSGGDHVYAAGAPEIIGPEQGASVEFVNSPGPTQRDISVFLGDGDVKFGIEGIVHGSMINILVEYRDGAGMYTQDKVCVRAAPFILYSHVKAVDISIGAGETVFIEDLGGRNVELRDVLKGRFGSDHVDGAHTGDSWHQDGYDSGYQAAPYQTMPMIFGLPRGQRGSDNLNRYTQNVLLRPGVGLVHNFQYLAGHGYGGNLEAIPGAPKQFFHGGQMRDEITDFLAAQSMQREVELYTSFLNVGHVDELASYAPDGRHVLVSSPEVGWALLLIAANINEDAIMQQGVTPAGPGGMTVREVMDDYEDYNFNVVLDPFNLPRFRNDLGLGSAASLPQPDPDNASDQVALSKVGGLIGFMDGNRVRTFKLTFSSGTNFNLEYQDGDGPWLSDGSGRYGENFISNSHTAFILDRWWRAESPESGDIYTFTVNPRSSFIEVPIIFRDAGGALAFTKNNVNSLVSGETIITAETVGPVVDWGEGAQDIFGYYIDRIYSGAGYSNVVFADEMEYHNRHGSIHCGSNVLRNIPRRYWWE